MYGETNLAFWSGLTNIAFAALVTLIVAFWEPSKNIRAAFCVGILITALANFYLQRSSSSSLVSEIATLKLNRWDPLNESEGILFSQNLSKVSKPTKLLQIVCGVAGCGDLAQSIRVSAAKVGWDATIAVPMFGSNPGLEFWYYEDTDLDFIRALEAAAPRIRAVRKRFDSNEHGQINLFIGSKS